MTMRTVAKAVLGILAVAWVFQGTISPLQAQTKLRYQFKPGQKINYEMSQTMKMDMKSQNVDISSEMEQVVDLTWHIKSVSKDGTAEVTQKFNDLRFVMKFPTVKVVFDSAKNIEPQGQVGKTLTPLFKAMVGAEFSMKMDSRGQISDVEIPEEFAKQIQSFSQGGLGDMFSKEGFKRMMGQSGLVLPKETVEKGGTWSQQMEMKSPIGLMNINTEYLYKGQEQRNGTTLEKIAVSPKVSLQPDPKAKTKATLKNQDISGTSYFNNQTGQLVEVKINQNMTMEIQAGDMSITQEIKQDVTLKQK